MIAGGASEASNHRLATASRTDPGRVAEHDATDDNPPRPQPGSMSFVHDSSTGGRSLRSHHRVE